MTHSTSGPELDGGMEGSPLLCTSVRDDLAPYLQGDLPADSNVRVSEHLTGCAECRGEAAFLETLRSSRPELPVDLAQTVLARLSADATAGRSERVPGRTFRRRAPTPLLWGLPAAAIFVLALGVTWLWNGGGADSNLYSLAFEAPSSSWGHEEWYVAGAPHLDGLSDEMLRVLMEEYD